MNLLDPRFKYVPAVKTNVLETFLRHGFKITTDAERRARQARYQSEDDSTVAYGAGANPRHPTHV